MLPLFSRLSLIRPWIHKHKIWSLILIAAISGLGYVIFRNWSADDDSTRYVLAAAESRPLIALVSGSGQISASNQLELTAKASGDIITLPIITGQQVAAGSLIAQLDASDAYYDLESAQLSYDKLVAINPDDLQASQDEVDTARESLAKTETSARNALVNASTQLDDALTDLDGIFSDYLSTANNSISDNATKKYIDTAKVGYYEAKRSLRDWLKAYRLLSATSPRSEIKTLAKDVVATAKLVAQAAKQTQDAVAYRRDRDNDSDEAANAYTTVTTLVATANSTLVSLEDNLTDLEAQERSLESAERELLDLKNGPDSYDLRSSQLTVEQKRNALSDYTLRAPFDGLIASVGVKRGDRVSNGTVIATLITKEQQAEISLNEVDAAKVKLGQPATLTFDALEDLTLKGTIAEVDLLGTVSQGVVNYSIKIAFENTDERIKPGMTVNAEIVTDRRDNALAIPSGALKTQGNRSYVEVVKASDLPAEPISNVGVTLNVLPERIAVTTGLSTDEAVEIQSGLNVGDYYVVRTINPSATSQQTSATPSLFGTPRNNTTRSLSR